MNKLGNWTDERVDLLRKLWAEGYSCSVIAAEIGGITRNAVIGKVTRLGLQLRKTQKDGRPRGERWREAHRTPRRRFVFPQAPTGLGPEPFIEPPKAPDHLGLTFDQLTSGAIVQCRFIDGDVRERTHTYCGQPVQEGYSYCAFHKSVCLHTPNPKQRSGFQQLGDVVNRVVEKVRP